MHHIGKDLVGRSRVLLAEDDFHLRRLIALHLSRDGHEVVEARDGREALELLGSAAILDQRLAAIVMDVRMPGRTGLAILRGLHEAACATPIVLITAFGDEALHREAGALGAKAVLDKPIAMEVLRKLVNDSLEPTELAELTRLRAWSADRMLVERYLDVLNRALADRGSRRRAGRTSAPVSTAIDLTVVGLEGGPTSRFVLARRPLGGWAVASDPERAAEVRCEIERSHLETVIANPWRYLAFPEELVLWL